LGLGVNNSFRPYDAFAIFNILIRLDVNISGHEGKVKLSSFCDGQYPIIFDGYLNVRWRFKYHRNSFAGTLGSMCSIPGLHCR
jgi:hypothetical protein